MDNQKIRIILYIAIALIVGSLWMRWQAKFTPKQQTTPTEQVNKISNANHKQKIEIPNLNIDNSHKTITTKHKNTNTVINKNTIKVHTKLLNVEINLQGGNLIKTDLNKYPVKLHSKKNVTFMYDFSQNDRYIAQSGLISKSLPTVINFTTHKKVYEMTNNNKLLINLYWQKDGLQVIKTYTFYKNKYLVKVNYKITNNTTNIINTVFYGQLLRTPPNKSHHGLFSSYATYIGGSASTDSNHYQKIKFSDFANDGLNTTSHGGWVSMVEQYFVSAWIPSQNQSTKMYTRQFSDNIYGIGIANPVLNIKPHTSVTTGAKLYIGPAITKNLEAAAPYLRHTIDYGWLWFIAEGLFWLLQVFYNLLGNWGWAIIALTVLIKIVFHPLSVKSYKSMAKMRILQPRIAKLREQYGDDKQKLGKATMELYKKEGASPLGGGCLPMLVQIPVFIALYWVLLNSVELRQAPWIFWIHDLATKDPYYILPILMGASMLGMQLMQPAAGMDPKHAKMMLIMPVIFTALFLNFASGLVLYWLLNNLISMAQQWYITKKFEASYAANKYENKKKK